MTQCACVRVRVCDSAVRREGPTTRNTTHREQQRIERAKISQAKKKAIQRRKDVW